MSRLEANTVKHNGVTTSYYDEGQGPVLLLLHGFTGSKLDFHDQLAWFADAYRVVVPDIRGHGESTNTEDEATYTLDKLVDDLESFIDVLGLRDIHLLGHSMGGMVVLRYALSHHQDLASLMLMDTSSAPLTMREEMREMFKSVIEKQGVQGLINLMRSAPKPDQVKNGIDFLGEEEHWNRIEEKLGQMDMIAYKGLAAELGTSNDITESLVSISCPTTVLVGEADEPFVEPSRRMAEMVPNAELHIISGASHCPQYENAARWKEVISAHLNRSK
jgi:2-succinyl-6-hydroxy-2,4-cyclohexadiene-1-carboxylate synthase